MGTPSPTATRAVVAARPEPVYIPPDPRFRGSAHAVFFAGDSLTHDAWFFGSLASQTRARGLDVSGIYAQGGLRAGRLESLWPRFAGALPAHVVIAIGTNDVILGTRPAVFASRIKGILRMTSSSHVVLVGIFAESDASVAARAAVLNALLRTIARGRSRVVFADWARLRERHPQWALAGDPFAVHLTDAGLRARARFYVDCIVAP